MGIHGQTMNKTYQENDTKNPRKTQSANTPFTLDEGATTMSHEEHKLTNSQVVSVPPSSFAISQSCSQSCLPALQGFSKLENTAKFFSTTVRL